MQLPRRLYLELAGVELHMLKALQRRSQVPLLGGGLKGLQAKDEVEATKYFATVDAGGYSPAEALMLAIADHMVTQNSFSRSSAKHIVQGWWNVLPEAVQRAEAGESIWYAVGSWDFGHDKQPDEDGNRAHWSWVEAGTFDEVIAAIREEQATVQEKHGGSVDNIAMFDLSLIVRKAHERGAALNLDVKSFFPPLATESGE